MTLIVRLEAASPFQLFNSISILVEDKKVKSLEQILETRKKVKSEIAQLKEKLQQTREKIAEFKELVAAQNPQPWKCFWQLVLHLNWNKI